MQGRGYIVFLVAVAALAAGWAAGSAKAVLAQGETSGECHYTLFGDRYMSTRTFDRPDVFLLDECTGRTWILNGREWLPINR